MSELGSSVVPGAEKSFIAEKHEQKMRAAEIGHADGQRFVQMVTEGGKKTVIPGSVPKTELVAEWAVHAINDKRISSGMKDPYIDGFVSAYMEGYGYPND